MRLLLVAATLLAFVSSLSSAFRLTASRNGGSSIVLKMDTNKEKAGLNLNLEKFTKKALPVLLGATLLVGNPFFPVQPAEAARSGGRSGGSSFRSAPTSRSMPSRSSTSLGGSRSGYATRPSNNIVIAPMGGFGYSPFYSPFGFGGGFGFGISPFSFLSPNVLVLGLAAYIAVQVLSNRAGGSDFSNFDDSGSLGSGATLMKIQVALDDDWSSKGNIMDTLSVVSSKYSDLSSRSALSQLLSDTSLALLRKSADWNAVAYDGEFFRGGNSREVEPAFQRVAVRERSKFDQETSGVARYSGIDSRPTQVVVSLLVALRGKSQAYADKVSSSRQLKECLQNLAADALTDEGENIMAVELLFTPSEPGSVISERDIIEDYPELLRL